MAMTPLDHTDSTLANMAVAARSSAKLFRVRSHNIITTTHFDVAERDKQLHPLSPVTSASPAVLQHAVATEGLAHPKTSSPLRPAQILP